MEKNKTFEFNESLISRMVETRKFCEKQISQISQLIVNNKPSKNSTKLLFTLKNDEERSTFYKKKHARGL